MDPDGLNLTTTYDYDAWFNVDSVQDPLGGTTTYTFDTLRRKKQATSPSPLSIDQKWVYNATGQVVTYEIENLDKDGASVTANPWITTTYTYTVLGDLASLTEEIGDGSSTRTTSFSYNASQQQTLVTKPEGNKVETQYNERGLVSKVIYGQGSLVESDVEYFYDDDANLTVVRDGRNNDTTTTWDAFGRRVKVEDPLGHYTTYTLDKRGQVTEEARKDSGDNTLARRSFYFDERGRLWKTSDLRKDPGTTYSDAVTTIKRKKTGHVYEVVDPLSRSTVTTFDAAWRRTAVQDAMGNETTWTLNANGWPTAWSVEEVDGQGTVTHQYEATYDALGRRLTLKEIDRTDSQNSITTTSGYDSRGNLVWQVNGQGDPTRYTFDAAGRMTMKEVALSTGQTIEDFTTKITTTWAFDKNDRLTSHKDDAQNTSTWAYDAKDRVTVMTYPDSSTISYTLDAADNVTQVIDAIGNDIDDTYNANNWRTARTVTRATGVIDTTSESFSYDGLGRLTAAEDNDYKVEFTYAVLGFASMPYEEKQSFVGGTAYTKTVTKTYDAAGMKVSELYPSGLDLDYTWNDIDRMATVTDGTSTIASFAYVGSRPKTVTYQNGTTVNYAWGPYRSQVLGVHHKDSGTNSLLNLQYGYDANHDRLYERFGASGSSGDAFAYDMARRLETAWMGSATPSNPTSAAYVKKIEYNMDDDGNRSSVVVTPYQQSSSSTSYTDNSLNQYTAVGGVSQAHDGNGNLKDDGTYLYEYNYRSLLCRVKLKSDNSTVATYKHDALGRRVEKDLVTSRERYIYSGFETVSVYDSSDTWVRDFVFGEGIDEPLMLRQADVTDFDGDQDTSEVTRHFYHRNALGSVLLLTDMNESEGVSYRYDPYGAVTISVGGTPQSDDPLGNPWMFTARFQDEETGLMYYRARQYAPGVGRFLQRDPLGYLPGPNLFAYASAAPTVRTDPLGLKDSPQKTAVKAVNRAVKDAKDAMAGCTGAQYTTARQCQECCGFATWDALAALGDAATTLAAECAQEYPEDKEEAEQLGADVEDAIDSLEALEAAEVVAEALAAVLEGVAAEAVGQGYGAGTSLGYHVAGSWAAIHGATSLLNLLSAKRALELEAAGNKYVKCIRQGAAAIGRGKSKIQAAHDECLDNCRKKWGKKCGITSNRRSWDWLLENDDYRHTD